MAQLPVAATAVRPTSTATVRNAASAAKAARATTAAKAAGAPAVTRCRHTRRRLETTLRSRIRSLRRSRKPLGGRCVTLSAPEALSALEALSTLEALSAAKTLRPPHARSRSRATVRIRRSRVTAERVPVSRTPRSHPRSL